MQDPNTSHLYKKILALNYKIPSNISQDAKSMIKGLLTHPQKRLELDQILNHSFYKQIKDTDNFGIVVGKNLIPIDEKIL